MNLGRQNNSELTIARAHNSTYQKKAGFTFGAASRSCSKDSFVVNESLVFLIKFCDKIHALRLAANR